MKILDIISEQSPNHLNEVDLTKLGKLGRLFKKAPTVAAKTELEIAKDALGAVENRLAGMPRVMEQQAQEWSELYGDAIAAAQKQGKPIPRLEDVVPAVKSSTYSADKEFMGVVRDLSKAKAEVKLKTPAPAPKPAEEPAAAGKDKTSKDKKKDKKDKSKVGAFAGKVVVYGTVFQMAANGADYAAEFVEACYYYNRKEINPRFAQAGYTDYEVAYDQTKWDIARRFSLSMVESSVLLIPGLLGTKLLYTTVGAITGGAAGSVLAGPAAGVVGSVAGATAFRKMVKMSPRFFGALALIPAGAELAFQAAITSKDVVWNFTSLLYAVWPYNGGPQDASWAEVGEDLWLGWMKTLAKLFTPASSAAAGLEKTGESIMTLIRTGVAGQTPKDGPGVPASTTATPNATPNTAAPSNQATPGVVQPGSSEEDAIWDNPAGWVKNPNGEGYVHPKLPNQVRADLP
jgi:hypothetical protein